MLVQLQVAFAQVQVDASFICNAYSCCSRSVHFTADLQAVVPGSELLCARENMLNILRSNLGRC